MEQMESWIEAQQTLQNGAGNKALEDEILKLNSANYELNVQLESKEKELRAKVEAAIEHIRNKFQRDFNDEKYEMESKNSELLLKLQKAEEELKKGHKEIEELLFYNNRVNEEKDKLQQLTGAELKPVLERALLDQQFFSNLMEASKQERIAVNRPANTKVEIESAELKELRAELEYLRDGGEKKDGEIGSLRRQLGDLKRQNEEFEEQLARAEREALQVSNFAQLSRFGAAEEKTDGSLLGGVVRKLSAEKDEANRANLKVVEDVMLYVYVPKVQTVRIG